MKSLVIFFFLLLTVAGPAGAGGFEARKAAGDCEVRIWIDRNPPVQGENTLTIEIRDGAGKKLTDLNVLVNYYMPPMPRMAPMNYKADARLKGEQYRLSMSLIMSGPWYIVVIFPRGGKTLTAKFNIDVQ